MESSTTGVDIDGRFAEIREKVLKLSHNEENVGMFWKLISFPIHPQFYGYTDEEQEELRKITQKELDRRLLRLVTPEYPDDILDLASCSPSPGSGKYFDVVSLLSSFGGRDLVRNNGDRVALNTDTFKGKYVIVCCSHVPIVNYFQEIQELVNLCNELYSTRDDFEMVMVARMNSSVANSREVLDHFFSGLPKSCLVLPFEDNQRRDYICKVLGFNLRRTDDNHRYLFLNDKGKVLPSWIICRKDEFGAQAFPFTEDIRFQSDVECRELIFENVSLERILRCNDFSPDFVYKINPRRVEVPVSQISNDFKNKHVGIYLCSEGELLMDLLDMYEQCREEGLVLEIVVVYQPFDQVLDPKIFQEKIEGLLKRHNVCGWWCLPFNNSVSCRFLRLTREYNTEGGEGIGFDRKDKLIVVGPGVEHLDMYGACVMREQGIDAFPFTVEAGIQLRLKELQEITLESLFIDDDILFARGNDRNNVISIKKLQGKKIYLYIDKLGGEEEEVCRHNYERLPSIYIEMKATMGEGHSFEMVYVEVRRNLSVEDEQRNKIMSKMPWFICPINGTQSTNFGEFLRLLNKQLCYETYSHAFIPAFVGFGEDGRICCVHEYLSECQLGDTLYGDAERILGYDQYRDHRMQRFANPRLN